MHSTNEAYRCHLLAHLPSVATSKEAQQRLRFSMPHVLALTLLDLEPARPLLQVCYSGRRGGRTPHDPVAMLRCLLLMLMGGCTDPNQWVARLQGEPELAVVSGFPAGSKPPGVGTFYDFFHRLLDGPYQKRCAPQQPASQRVTGRSFRRVLLQESEAVKAETQAELARSQQGLVENLSDKALARQGVPQDLAQRLNEILMRCAVAPSAAAGLLGDLRRLVVSGDGTAIDSQANGWGQSECSCREQGQAQCTCPRLYSDPEATWGYDSARERYYFGYRLHAMVTRGIGDDLPLQILMAGANTPDVVLGVEAITRLSRRLEEADVGAEVFAAAYDKGYDAGPFYKLHQELEICPLIPLAQQIKTPSCAEGLPRNDQGTPLCPGGIPLRLHQRDMRKQELLYNCPVKRPGRTEGKLVFKTREEECPLGTLCEPESVMGPLVHIRLGKDPRMNLAIPRESPQFVELYKDRTATERYNSVLKSKGRMATGAYRRQHIAWTMAMLLAVELHADSWVKRTLGEARPRTVAELLGWLAPAQPAAQQAV